MMRNCKGVTLTALVITIIVLGIISAITILATTDIDISGQAKQATEDFNEASIKQIIDGVYFSEKNKYNSGLISEDAMWTNVKTNITSNTTVNFTVQNIDDSDITKGIKVNVNGKTMYKITMENGV